MAEFRFKEFVVDDCGCGMKVGTDSVLLGAWADCSQASRVCDLGAGSGLLALMAAQRSTADVILAVEIDQQAVKAAEYNFSHSPWAARLRAVEADALRFVPEKSFDLVISNPPYFTNEMVSPDARRAKARHANGMLGPITVVRIAAQWLSGGGSVAMVTPADDEDGIIYEAEMHRLKLWRQCMVHTVARKKPTRILWQFSRENRKFEKNSLVIRDGANFSAEYVALTKDFYLNL